MGIQINGNSDNISATDGSLSISGATISESLGIGTDSPQAKLHLYSGGPQAQWTDSDNDSDSRIRYNGSSFIFEADSYNEIADSAFSFRVDGANIAQEKVRISSGIGSVGIRTDDPKTPVDINCYSSDSDTYRGTVKINRYGHILQQNNQQVVLSGVSSYWALAPRDNGDYNITFSEVDAPNTFNASGFNVLTLEPNGNVSVPNGNVIIASGNGIQFSATTGAGSSISAQVLDDYEEGFFKPTLEFGGNSVDMTYNNSGLPTECREGYYTKVGRLVTCFLRIEITDKGSSTGEAKIQGLPFTVGNVMASTSVQGSATVGFVDGVSVSHTDFSMHPWEETDELRLYYKATAAGAAAVINDTHLENDFDFRATFSYMTD